MPSRLSLFQPYDSICKGTEKGVHDTAFHIFRMPLHSSNQFIIPALHGFDDAVPGTGGFPQGRSQFLDALSVPGVYIEAVTQNIMETAFLLIST